MARLGAIFEVGETVVKLLKDRRKLRGAVDGLPDPLLVSHLPVGAISKVGAPPAEGLTLICYRALPSGHARPQPTRRGTQRPSRLGLDLHYLLTAWSEKAQDEQTMLAWAMLELHKHAVFDSALLSGGAGVWDRDEIVQFAPEPVTHEAMFRIWDALDPKYRLSAAYCARVVHIQDGEEDENLPVVETNFDYADADPLVAGAVS